MRGGSYPRKNVRGSKITRTKMCTVSAGTKINCGTCAHFRGPAHISAGNQGYELPHAIGMALRFICDLLDF